MCIAEGCLGKLFRTDKCRKHYRLHLSLNKPICIAIGYTKPSVAKNVCSHHHSKLIKYGDPNGGGTHYSSPEERFHTLTDKSKQDTDCWLWLGKPNTKDGYGCVYDGKRKILAHRFAYELYNEHIEDSLFVCHNCDNTMCVNPDHLFVGTNYDNVQDKVSKGRQNKGETSPTSKLLQIDIDYIRKVYSDKVYNQSELAQMFNVSQSCISSIIRRVNWKHV